MDAAAIEAFGRSWVSWLGTTNLWTLGALAAVVLFDRAAARHVSAGWRMTLYAVVLARLVWPGAWTSPVGLIPGESVAPQAAALTAAAGSTIAAPEFASVSLDAAPRWSWGTGALLIHLLGAVVLFGRLIAGQRRLARIRSTAARIEAPATNGARAVEHPSAGPMAVGVFDPVIVVPSAALELPTAELAGIIRHERAHLQHRDPALQFGLLTLRALLWPVAAVWIAAGRLRALMEVRADAAATRPLDAAGTRSYGALLLRVASMGELTPPAVGLGHSELRARLRALGHRPRTSVPVQAAAVLLAAAASSALIAERVGSEASMPTTAIAPSVVAAAETPAEPEQCILDRDWVRPASAPAKADERFAKAQAMLEADDFEGAEQELQEVAWIAASTKYDDLAAVAAGQLMSVTLARYDVDTALAWGRHGAAAYERVPPTRDALKFHRLRAELQASIGDAEGAAKSTTAADALSALCP